MPLPIPDHTPRVRPYRLADFPPPTTTCLPLLRASQWTPLSCLTPSCATHHLPTSLAAPKLSMQYRPSDMSDGTLPARTKHGNWCGNELFDGISARRLGRRHNSAAHLPLSPHLVLKVLISSLEIIHLREQQLAQRVFVLLVRLRATAQRTRIAQPVQ